MKLVSREIIERTTSSFPISIGTALALESLMDGKQPPYDPAREIPERIDLKKYQEFWINVDTLLRNLIGSMSSNAAHEVPVSHLVEALIAEKDIIVELVRESTNDGVRVVFYHNDKSDLAKHHPHAALRRPATDKQMFTKLIEQKTVQSFMKAFEGFDTVKSFKKQIKPDRKCKAIVLTHQAYDLLSAHSFDQLDLLESHTGLLKPRSLWYTKFNEKGLVRIPFNTCTIQVFGDSTTFKAFPQAVRKELVELAEKYNWNPLTTKDRMRLGIESMKDVFTAKVLKTMLNE